MTEFLLVVAVPLLWAVWELVALERSRPRPPRTPDPDRPPTGEASDHSGAP